jgi:hypothetical protein
MIRSEPFELITRPQRSKPALILGALIRWRAEILIATTLLVAWVWLTDRIPVWAAGTTLGVLTVGVLVWPTSRRYVIRRGYAVMLRHRLRSAFVERRVMNYSGNLPLVLWARPTPVGEKVWLLLRAGIDLRDGRAMPAPVPRPVPRPWSPSR